MNNSRIVRECRRYLNFLSGRFTSVSLVWVTGKGNISTSSSELVRSFRNSLQLNWVCHFPRSSCTSCGNFFRTPSYFWSIRSFAPSQDLPGQLPTNQLHGLGSDVISTTMGVLTGHCAMGSHVERMRLSFNVFCRGCK